MRISVWLTCLCRSPHVLWGCRAAVCPVVESLPLPSDSWPVPSAEEELWIQHLEFVLAKRTIYIFIIIIIIPTFLNQERTVSQTGFKLVLPYCHHLYFLHFFNQPETSIRDGSVPALLIMEFLCLRFNYRALVWTHFKLLWQLCKCVSVAKYQMALVQFSKVFLDVVSLM